MVIEMKQLFMSHPRLMLASEGTENTRKVWKEPHERLGGLYEGQVDSDGNPDGIGMYVRPGHSFYEGHWKAGKFHGKGVHLVLQSYHYEGEWQNN